MTIKISKQDANGKRLISEVVKEARTQNYTPDQLCVLQKVIETQYYYWWIMDTKQEELAKELFTDDFEYIYNGYKVPTSPAAQARQDKWVNAAMVTMHMGHQPLVWLQDDDHARGIFQYEDHQVYVEDGKKVETWMVYCNDFVKVNDCWKISSLRVYPKQEDGKYSNIQPPEDFHL